MKFDEIIGIQRGRNHMTHKLMRSITRNDYFFDYRGIAGGSKFNLLWLLGKAWICSREIPKAKFYLIEGALCFWVGFFLKKRYPSSKLLVIFPEPAFYLDQRKNFLQRFFHQIKIKAIKSSMDFFIPASMMVYRDAMRQLKIELPFYHLKYPIQPIQRVIHQSDKNILFVIERPHETGYVKGYDLVLKIFKKVHEVDSESKLFLIGTGTEDLSKEDENIFGMGRMKMEEAYRLGSIIISPARYDAFLMVVPEGGSAGLIPLTSQNVGASDLFQSDFPENVIQHDNLEHWVERIRECFSLSAEYREKVYHHFQKVIDEYSEQKIFEDFNFQMKNICQNSTTENYQQTP